MSGKKAKLVCDGGSLWESGRPCFIYINTRGAVSFVFDIDKADKKELLGEVEPGRFHEDDETITLVLGPESHISAVWK